MPRFKSPSATPSGTAPPTGAGKEAAKTDLVIDISEGVTELLGLRGAGTVSQLKEIVADCCLQACDCCLQIS